MQYSLFYCMSNTQLRKIVYAYGKSYGIKNKAASILRLRKQPKQLQANMGGFTLNYNTTKCEQLKIVQTKFTFKSKKEAEVDYFYKPSYYFTLQPETTGSLCLQGRTSFNCYKVLRQNKNNNYKRGGRRVNSRPRIYVEESDEVPVHLVRTPVAQNTSQSEGAITCGLNTVPGRGLKPMSATTQTTASTTSVDIGLSQRRTTPTKIFLLYVLIYLLVRIFKPKFTVYYLAGTFTFIILSIIILILYLFVKMIIRCNTWCYNMEVAYRAIELGQRINGVVVLSQEQMKDIEDESKMKLWD